jgi:hypothetical protein
MRLCFHWSVEFPQLHFEPPRLHFSLHAAIVDVHGPLWLSFEPLIFQNFDFNANPDPALHFNADPFPDPDPQPCGKVLCLGEVELFSSVHFHDSDVQLQVFLVRPFLDR